jgi:PAS domain S-box-containing protein
MPLPAENVQPPGAPPEMCLAALESAGEAIFIADPDGNIIYVNPAFERITQYTRKEAVGCNPRLLKCDRNDPAIYTRLWRTISEGKVWRGTFLNRKKDGSIYQVEQTIAPAINGQGRTVGYVSVHRDVTDSRCTQDVLQLAAAVESAGDGIALADVDGGIVYVNAALEFIHGQLRTELVGQNLQKLFSEVEGSATLQGQRMWQTVTHGAVWRGAHVVQRPHRAPLHVEKTVAPVHNAAGSVIGYVSVERDVTEWYARQHMARDLAAAQHEMDLAKSVQQRLFPSDAPKLVGFDLAGRTYPADHVCGDYFDFIPSIGNSLGIAVGDVSGHGLSAALLMVGARAYVRSLSNSFFDVGEILSRVNRLLAPDIESVGFVTMLFAWLDPRQRTLVYAGAGHDGYLLHHGGQVLRLESTGLPLGIREDELIAPGPEIELNSGDIVLLATDGLAETYSPTGELFGVSRALDVVRQHRHEPAEAIVEALHAASREFAQGAPKHDDITIVLIKCEKPSV